MTHDSLPPTMIFCQGSLERNALAALAYWRRHPGMAMFQGLHGDYAVCRLTHRAMFESLRWYRTDPGAVEAFCQA